MKLNGKRLLMSADPSSFLSLISLCNFNFHKIKLDIKFQVITHVQLIVQQSTQDGRQAHSITKLKSANPAQSPPSYSELKDIIVGNSICIFFSFLSITSHHLCNYISIYIYIKRRHWWQQ